MRMFVTADGRSWSARIYDGPQGDEIRAPGVGWEAVLFEQPAEGAVQRLVYRPAGWLAAAGIDELRDALEQSEAVRARWDAAPQQAGG